MSQTRDPSGRFTVNGEDGAAYIRDVLLSRPPKHLGLIQALAPQLAPPSPPLR